MGRKLWEEIRKRAERLAGEERKLEALSLPAPEWDAPAS
jgi:hypothetical protein